MEFVDYFISENVTDVNPIDYIKKGIIAFEVGRCRAKLYSTNPYLAAAVDENLLLELGNKYWEVQYDNLLNIKLSNKLMTILEDNNLSKNEQETILKGESISPFEMQSLFIQAFNNFNYKYSYYHFDLINIKKEDYKLPKIFNYNKNKLTKIKDTDLSDSELKQMINQRNSRIVHFLNNGEYWHCFFITYRSISGKEAWETHYHYLSDKWNIEIKNAIEQFKNQNYPSTKVHIICKK